MPVHVSAPAVVAAGTLLASGSDDLHIGLWDFHSSKPLLYHSTGHTANIFCVKFMPTTGEAKLVLAAYAAATGVRHTWHGLCRIVQDNLAALLLWEHAAASATQQLAIMVLVTVVFPPWAVCWTQQACIPGHHALQSPAGGWLPHQHALCVMCAVCVFAACVCCVCWSTCRQQQSAPVSQLCG